VSPESFADKYDVDDEHTATPKKIIKYAKLADHDGVLHTSWATYHTPKAMMLLCATETETTVLLN
jgi:hypothetical protein